jgi:hypothetical protein
MPKKETQDEAYDGLAAKVRGLDGRVSKIEKFLRAMYGSEETPEGDFDASKLGRGLLGVLVAVLLISGIAIGATIWNVRDLPDTYDIVAFGDDGTMTLRSAAGTTNLNVDSSGNVVISSGLTVGGMTMYSGAFADADGSLTVSNVTLTAGGVLTIGATPGVTQTYTNGAGSASTTVVTMVGGMFAGAVTTP